MSDDLVLLLCLMGPPVVAEGLFLFLLLRKKRRTRMGSNWRRTIGINLASLVIIAATSFAGGELCFRYHYDTTEALGITRVTKRWIRRHYVPNPGGMRDNVDYALAIKPGLRRVTFLGDSFTVGHGIKNIEDRFANIIRRREPGWEIQILAEMGDNTGDEIRLLQGAVKEGYQLDEVVLVYCLNDIEDLNPKWSATIKQVYAQAAQRGWWRRHSYLVDTLYLRYAIGRNPEVANYYNYLREGYGTALVKQQEWLRQLNEYIKEHGGHLQVVTFPFLHVLGPDYPFQAMHDQLGRFWANEGVPHLDLLSIYSNLPPSRLVVNRHDAHPNEYANALAADVIGPFLKTNLVNSPPR